MRIYTTLKRFVGTVLAAVLLSHTNANAQADMTKETSRRSLQTIESPAKGLKLPADDFGITKRMIDAHTSSIASKAKATSVATNAQIFLSDDVTLFGNLIYAGSWLTTGNMPFGIYQINPKNGKLTEVFLDDALSGAGTYANGKIYSCQVIANGQTLVGLRTHEVDMTTHKVTKTWEHDIETYDNYAVNMTYDPTEDIIYTLNYNSDASGVNLCTLNPHAGTYDVVAPTIYYAGITIDSDGQMYVISKQGEVFEMDKKTAEIGDKIASTGFEPVFQQSACWSPKDKKIYWAATNEMVSRLIAIDPYTGISETLATFADNEEITCLYSTDPIADPLSPAKPKLSATYSTKGDLQVNIHVTAPIKDMSGNTLKSDENLQLTIKVDGQEISSAAIIPGGTWTGKQTLTEGNHTIIAYCSNAAGDGQLHSVKTYAGEDTPEAVGNLRITDNGQGKVTLTWDAPIKGVNDGWLNTSTLHYTIERNGEKIKENLTQTSFTEQLTGPIAANRYTVIPLSRTKQGAGTTVGPVIYGDALPLPYEENFKEETSMDLLTIVDNNKDSSTWERKGGRLQYNYSETENADDYVFTPPLHLSNEQMVSVEVDCSVESEKFTEKLEITLGQSTDGSQQTVVLPATAVNWTTPQTLQAYFKVPTSGDYHIGMHAVSDADNYYLYIQRVKVEIGPALDAPLAPTAVTATSDPTGKLQATIRFTAPTKSFRSSNLNDKVTVAVLRNGTEKVGEKEVAPGTSSEIIDNNAQQGINIYTVTASNSHGTGDHTTVSCFCGMDKPTNVERLTLVPQADNMSANLNWTAVSKGQNGGFIGEVKYRVYIKDEYSALYNYIDETSELKYTVTTDNPALKSYQYAVTAFNTAGESDFTTQSALLGKPYEAPFEETLANGKLASSPWFVSGADGAVGCSVMNSVPPLGLIADDQGMFVFYDQGTSGGACRLQVPKIKFNNLEKPILKFALYHYAEGQAARISIKASRDDISYTEIYSTNLSGEPGWHEHEVDLSELKDAPWISFAIECHVPTGTYVCVDYFKVTNASSCDLSVRTVEGPSRIAAGETAVYTATVQNDGAEDADYTVNLHVDGTLIANQSQYNILSKDENTVHTFKYTPKAGIIGRKVEVKVTVVPEESTDEMPENNAMATHTFIAQPALPAVTDLDGTSSSDFRNVELTWSEPMVTPEETVDGFESYDSFGIDNFGDYTFEDGDGMKTYGLSSYEFPNMGEPMAFMVWSPEEMEIIADNFQVRTGKKCIISFAARDDYGYPTNDDYLISPEIVGGTEVIFYANNPLEEYPELFEVLYSTTTNDVDEFIQLTTESQRSTTWQKYAYMMPADAKYFAIHYVSSDAFALLIDDLSYVKAGTGEKKAVEGYHVYKNGTRVTDTPIMATNYNCISDNTSNGWAFNVTAMYKEGESIFSNTKIFGTPDGIATVKTGITIRGTKASVEIYGAQGRNIKIYAVDGSTMCDTKATGNTTRVLLDRGFYIVTVDGMAAQKVRVE